MTATALRKYDAPQWPAPLGIGSRFSLSVSEPVRWQRPQISTPSTTTDPSWPDPTLARVNEIINLKQNWDGRGSAEVRYDTLAFACSLLTQVMPPGAPAPAIVPLGHGGVQLLWANAVADLEVEVVQPNEIVAYHLDRRTGDEREWQLTTQLSVITNILWSNFTT